MATELYFDTARLGRMCTEARKAERDFAKLASRLGSSLYFERFLAEGFSSLPSRLRDRLLGLCCWPGVTGLKHGLQRFVSLPPSGDVLLASQSSTLITLAAELLFRRCDAVLATDLEWPPYLVVLNRVARLHGKRLIVIPLRQQVLSANMDRAALVRQVVDAYRTRGCDGLFLSDITHTAVRMPIVELLHRLSAERSPLFTVIDGAQALGQRPIRLDSCGIDLYLAGTQKWFGGYHPLRMAFVSPKAGDMRDVLRRLKLDRRLSDPLHEFCESIESRSLSRFGETVNLTPLITAAGALAHWTASPNRLTNAWHLRRQNLRHALKALAPFARAAIHPSLTSGAALVQVQQHRNSRCRRRAPCAACGLRLRLSRNHITASEPVASFARLAMPDVLLTSAQTTGICKAFDCVTDAEGSGPEAKTCERSETARIIPTPVHQ